MIDAPQPTDAPAIAALAEKAFIATFGHMYPPADLATFLGSWNPPAKVAAQIADPDYGFRVAHGDNGDMVGFVKIGPLDFDLPADEPEVPGIELHQLYLDAAAKGQGVAKALMDWAVAEARSRGAARLYLSVFIDNHRAQAFYRKYGFAEIGKNPFRVGNTIDDDRIWRLIL
jgi:ribosomal protein S18 acetylase RimI-like enzyme